MNDIQIKLLNIFKEYDRVCKAIGVKYFAIAGTALGAQRHSGFIPWDDDMDFGMLREDYDKFMNEAPNIINKRFFVQNYKTDREWLAPFAKVRDCETTAIEKILNKKKINHGLWIDIFPIDYIPEKKNALKKYAFRRRLLLRRLTASYNYPFSLKRCLQNIFIRFLIPSKKTASLLLNENYKRRKTKTNLVANCFVFDKNKLPIRCPSEWFNEIVEMKFENCVMSVIQNNVNYLEYKYGNWKELPPFDQRKSLHTTEFIDLNNSYIKYSKD